MNDLLADINAYLVAQGAVDDSIVFLDYLPDQPDEAVAIYEYAGLEPIPQIAGALRSVQIQVRSTSNNNARQIAINIYNALKPPDADDDARVQLTDTRWAQIHMKQSPFKVRQDVNKRPYYGFNISIYTYTD